MEQRDKTPLTIDPGDGAVNADMFKKNQKNLAAFAWVWSSSEMAHGRSDRPRFSMPPLASQSATGSSRPRRIIPTLVIVSVTHAPEVRQFNS